MFSLIITIISIALVAALALATIYYGGSSFSRGTEEALASQLINEGQQINGAFTLNRADAASNVASTATTLAGLVSGNYLAQAPAGWSAAAGVASKSGLTAEVCQAINVKAGVTAASTADAADTNTTLVVAIGDLSSKVYGCITGGGNQVIYRY